MDVLYFGRERNFSPFRAGIQGLICGGVTALRAFALANARGTRDICAGRGALGSHLDLVGAASQMLTQPVAEIPFLTARPNAS